jgi:hypothetical protein
VLRLDGLCRVRRGEIPVHASRNRRNHGKYVIRTPVARGQLVDMLCQYDDHEIMCLLACGGPYNTDITKLESDTCQLQCVMKDMLDTLLAEFRNNGMDETGIYVLGVQVRSSQESSIGLEYEDN